MNKGYIVQMCRSRDRSGWIALAVLLVAAALTVWALLTV
jgi:hypothetical protein